MNTRTYDSPARTAAAAEKRARVVAAAMALLREGDDVTAVSLEAVAKAAGVTRLTVYNQFGSRRGLLEAVLEQVAHDTGIDKVGQAIAAERNPRTALDTLIEMICHTWGYDESMGNLHAAAQIDPEFAEAINARMERRRGALRFLVTRIREDKPIGEAQMADLVDLLFAQTSYPVFTSLRAGRTPEAVAALMKYGCHAAIANAAKLPPAP